MLLMGLVRSRQIFVMLWNQGGLWPLIFTVMCTVDCKQKSLDSVKPKPSNLFRLSIMTLCRVRPKGSKITGNVLLYGEKPSHVPQPSLARLHICHHRPNLDVGYASSTKNSTGLRKWDNGGRQTFMNYYLMLWKQKWFQTSTGSASSLELVRHKQDIPKTTQK